MRPERHYDDEALVTMLASGAGASDAHLGTCAECSEKLDSFRLVTDALHDAATWDKREISEAPNAATIASLRSFAETMAAEDTAADAFLADLLAGPRETWAATLAAHPEYRTPGTVRRLIAATDKALDTMPADAVEITGLAVSIAEGLDASAHRATTVATLRGQAWRERAYALFYTGQFAEAEKAVNVAERCFEACVVDEYELARVGIVRAVVEKGLERLPAGIAAASASASAFGRFADHQRLVSAKIAEIHLLLARNEFEAGRDELLRLEAAVRLSDDAQTHALLLGNLGYCARKLGRIEEAMQYQDQAAILHECLGNVTESTRIRWNVASLLAAEGRIQEALVRLDQVKREYERIGMVGVVPVVALEIAELLLTQERFAEVEELCKAAIECFERSGVAHTARAVTALGFMAEAVRGRTATPQIVRSVREYVRRLPEEPTLLFAQAFPN